MKKRISSSGREQVPPDTEGNAERARKAVPESGSSPPRSPQLLPSDEALASHQGFSISDIRRYAFWSYYGGKRSLKLQEHLKTCEICSERLTLLMSTDPMLGCGAKDQVTVVFYDEKPRARAAASGKDQR